MPYYKHFTVSLHYTLTFKITSFLVHISQAAFSNVKNVLQEGYWEQKKPHFEPLWAHLRKVSGLLMFHADKAISVACHEVKAEVKAEAEANNQLRPLTGYGKTTEK